MKLNGVKPEQNIVTEVFPRPNGDLIFKLRPVVSNENFVKLCPAPVAPKIVRPGGIEAENVEDPKYKEELEKHNRLYFNWLVISSLDATPGLEWETIDKSDPETWGNYEAELKDSNLSVMEVMRLVSATMDANSLSNEKIEKAKKDFLAKEALEAKSQ